MSRIVSSLWAPIILFAVTGTVARADEKLRVQNDFGEVLYLWIKSEAAQEWDRYLIGKDKSIEVSLAPSDKFQLVASDRQHGEYYTELLPLLEKVRANPDYVLYLSNPFANNVPRRDRRKHDIVFLFGAKNKPTELIARQRTSTEQRPERRP